MSRGALAPASGTRCMGKRVHQTPPPTTAQFVDPFHDRRALTPITGEERTILRTVNQKIAARPSLRAIVDYLFENTQALIPCDRIGLAFVDERGERVTSYYNRANYEPLYIDKDYSEALRQTSLSEVLRLSLIHISEPTRLGMISYAVFCLKKKKKYKNNKIVIQSYKINKTKSNKKIIT